MKLQVGDQIFYINPDTKPAKANDYRDFKNPENSVKFYLLFLYLWNQTIVRVQLLMIPAFKIQTTKEENFC